MDLGLWSFREGEKGREGDKTSGKSRNDVFQNAYFFYLIVKEIRESH